MPEDSSLYGSSSWCSSGVASSPQYLQFDFGKVVTVSGIATQGDAIDNKWVSKYAVSYGYDEQSWLLYAGGQIKFRIKDHEISCHVHSHILIAKSDAYMPNLNEFFLERYLWGLCFFFC